MPPLPNGALADDSGLCVDALGGAPGIYSARYSGEGATDQSNTALLLEKAERRRGTGAPGPFFAVSALWFFQTAKR
jgi:XTP/dITP diphosphohydrolase